MLSRTWDATTLIDIEFGSDLRAVPWPAKEPRGGGAFDGPLCLGLSSEQADISQSWAVLVDAAGRPVPDDQGRPQVAEPAGRTRKPLEAIAAHWLTPDVKNPARMRVLFQTGKAKAASSGKAPRSADGQER